MQSVARHIILKTESMPNFIIKTHQKNTLYTKPHLFILNKGMNSGKPQKEPFTNSFVIIFENESDFDTINLTAYALWKTKFWHQFLRGSVIPFLNLHDIRKEFSIEPYSYSSIAIHKLHKITLVQTKYYLLNNYKKSSGAN